ncbi:sensor histidine kinase [Brachybacterium hainanense]|uniref:histidine kinase n=1 Tax=Brachybacterium hainanense TaxID=1541174 RepID=A0ABV6R9Q0_9MICO
MTAWALLVVALVLAVGSFAAVSILARALADGVAVAAEQDLETLGDQAESAPAALAEIDDDLLVRLAGTEGGAGTINDDAAARLPELAPGESRRVVIDGEPYLVLAEDTDAGMLTVGRSLEHVDEAVATSRTLLIIAVPLMVLLVGGVVWVVTGRALAPVEELRRQVDAIDAAEPSARVDAGGNDELGALAATMNRMLERIERAQATQRRFVSDASHELRSPLATIRQHAELARAHPEAMDARALGDVVLAEGARMQDLVEGMLLLARLDERRERAATEVDLDDLALAEAERLRPMGVQVDARGIGPGRVIGDPVLLGRLLRNLVDNAARHADGTVALRVRGEGSRVLLEVEDDGSGIPEDERAAVFDRFARLDEGRARDEGGSGLGLAIVREVATSHGGSVTAGQGTLGGALLRVELPAAP